jgi:RNA polymerase sigma-70 factor (ECF subfamily)
MTEKEKTLLAGCIRSDKASWDAFVQQYSNLVYHTIRKTFVTYHAEPNPEEVDDLFQEFFLAIVRDDFKKLRDFRGERGCTLASWLRLVTVRLTIDFLRRDKLLPNDVVMEFDSPTQPPDSLLAKEEERWLSCAIEQLSPRERLLVNLCFRQEVSAEDIANILKISVNAVYTQKSRLLGKLREFLKQSSS